MRIVLPTMAAALSRHVQFEPEMFPGCVFRPDMSASAVCNLFTSGHLVITGVKPYAAAQDVLERWFTACGRRYPDWFDGLGPVEVAPRKRKRV